MTASHRAGIGVVTALQREAGPLARHPALTVRACGVAADGIGDTVRQLRDGGSHLIVSWGTAGALSPRLRAGDLVLPEYIISRHGDTFRTDSGSRNSVRGMLTGTREVSTGTLLESDRILETPDDKHGTGIPANAVAVDMESGRIGEACAALNLPFLVIRAVIDESHDRLPRIVHDCALPDGTLHVRALIAGLMRHPGDWAGLTRLVPRYRRARSGLEAAAQALSRYGAGERV
ncbi:MAG: hypothetical protein U5R46_07095 [Gammaproteobacteria bacterium]|nr:hypothetical protein [Gammaproteobacteria bacterium]